MGDNLSFVPNYTGPYISNGEFQSSVEFGNVAPKDELDAYSRLHDSAYAKFSDRLHRTVADEIYYEGTRSIDSQLANLAGNLVMFGNHTMRSAYEITDSIKYLGNPLLGLVVGGVRNAYDLYDYTINRESVRKEIEDYFDSDPYKHYQPVGRKMIRKSRLEMGSGWSDQKSDKPEPKGKIDSSSIDIYTGTGARSGDVSNKPETIKPTGSNLPVYNPYTPGVEAHEPVSVAQASFQKPATIIDDGRVAKGIYNPPVHGDASSHVQSFFPNFKRRRRRRRVYIDF